MAHWRRAGGCRLSRSPASSDRAEDPATMSSLDSQNALPASPFGERYAALFRVAQAIGAHRDACELFQALAPELRDFVQASTIGIARLDPESGEGMWLVLDVENREQTERFVEWQGSMSAWVYDTQQPLVVADLEQESRFPRAVE